MAEQNRFTALQTMLRPLVRFMLRGAHSIQDFIEVLKVVYVQVAQEELEKQGQNVNPSRLVMATGIHRIEVNRLLAEGAPAPKPEANMLFRIIGLWSGNKRYQDKKGRPKILTYKGKNSQFAKLLRTISLSLTPGTVQFELERIGAVEVTEKGLKLIKDFERMNTESPERYEIIARDVEYLLAAIEENLSRLKEDRGPNEVGNLHLRTEYDNVFIQNLPEIRQWIMKEGKELHKRTREYLSQFDKDISEGDDEAGGRVVLHGFSLTSPNGKELQELEDQQLAEAKN